MNYHSASDIFFADACLVYMVAGLFCALVRWFHICRPYSADVEYYYPARKQMSVFYALCVLQFPYVINPSSEATWIYVSIFGIIYYPACLALLFKRYFYRESIYDSLAGKIVSVFPMAVICTLCVASMVWSGWVESHQTALMAGTGGLSIILMSYATYILAQLKRKVDKYHYDNFSCEKDFPYRFAKAVVHLPILWFLLSWTVFLCESRWAKFVVDIIMTVFMVIFLLIVLHPQRNPLEEECAEAPGGDDGAQGQEDDGLQEVSGHKTFADEGEREEIRRELVEVIGRMYRNSGLLKTEVINEMGYGKKTLAKEYIAEVGFFNFVNAFRLEHARLYREAHPQATLDQIAEESGFRDRFALNYAKKKITFDYRALIGDFKPQI